MRARKRDRAYTPAVWALPRPYRQLSGRDVTQWGRQCAGQYTPLLLETIRPSTPGVPTHLSTVDFSPLLESAHPANLINIIADYAAPRSQWELRVKRYRRYEALALCASLSLSPFSAAPNGLYVDRRAIVGLPFTKSLYKKERKKESPIARR